MTVRPEVAAFRTEWEQKRHLPSWQQQIAHSEFVERLLAALTAVPPEDGVRRATARLQLAVIDDGSDGFDHTHTRRLVRAAYDLLMGVASPQPPELTE